MGRKRKRRDMDIYRPKNRPEPVRAATVDSKAAAKAFKEVKPVTGEYIIRVRRGAVTIEGEAGSQTLAVQGGEDTDTLFDAETAKAFTLLSGPVSIERRGDMLRISETTGRSPTAFSVPVRAPAEDFNTRTVDIGKPATYSGESRYNAVVRNAQGKPIATATIARVRSGDGFIVYQGTRPSQYGGNQRNILYSGPTLARATRFVRNLPGEVNV